MLSAIVTFRRSVVSVLIRCDRLEDVWTTTWAWWHHQMETFSALLAIWAGNSPVPGEFLAQRPVTRSFDVFFDLCLDKRLSKQSWGWWFETPSWSLWRQCNDVWTIWDQLIYLANVFAMFPSYSNIVLGEQVGTICHPKAASHRKDKIASRRMTASSYEHYSDVTWASWRRKSHHRHLAYFFRVLTKEMVPLVLCGIRRWSVVSHHKGLVMGKTYPCHDVIMCSQNGAPPSALGGNR